MNKFNIRLIVILIILTSCKNIDASKSMNLNSSQNEDSLRNQKITTESFEIDLSKFNSFYNSIKGNGNKMLSYDSKERKNFQRFPGVRVGTQINELTTEQRINLHDLFNDILSPKGYLKMLNIISNEDAAERTDEELGREKYWITFFGKPQDNKLWGFRFEGHHFSLNLSFNGNSVISTTPFIYGANPSTMKNGRSTPFSKEDIYREGFNILFEEEDKGLEFINSLDSIQFKKCYNKLTTGIHIVCEDNQILDLNNLYTLAYKDDGIVFKELNKQQQIKLSDLIDVYFGNYLKTKNYSLNTLLEKNTKFIINGDIEKGSKYYYRIVNNDFIIEFQNVGNHIHCLVRDFNKDFGMEK